MKKDLTTLFTGRHYTLLPEIDSTNSYLSDILGNIDLPEGSVIRAVKQNAGRGQKGTAWESEEGKNLLLSFLFFPKFIEPKQVFLLNKTFALGVHDFALIWLKNHITIKWPNDIYWKKKKLCGILIENSITSSLINHSILGIGINVNQTSFSKELLNAVSFAIVKRKQFDLERLFNSLCHCIESRYLQLKNGEQEIIDKNYHSVLFNLDKWKIYESNSIRFKGRIDGVDENGKLIVGLMNGQEKRFDLKEIRFIEE
jgi:BirA family biotin operon repressor/biotin-[acetyl-CoA-carboxylase] ligase